MRAGKGKPKKGPPLLAGRACGLGRGQPPGAAPGGRGWDHLSGGCDFCKSQNLGSKNPQTHLFLTPLAKGKLKKTTVLLEQNKQRSVSD